MSIELEGLPPLDILRWAADRFAPRLTFATGFGVEGATIIDLVGRHRLPVDLFTLDTGLLFPETYDLWKRLEARYGVTIRAVRPEITILEQSLREGDCLWERQPSRCCELRKIVPLRAELAKFDAWITAIRRDQTPDRAGAKILEHDANFGLVKLNPLAAWTSEQVWAHVREFDVPFNPLHERGYPSIGCRPCTTPVRPGEDPRAGRWRGSAKTECGLHARTGQPQGAVSVFEAPRQIPQESQERSTQLYPLFLKLDGRRVLLVGGGRIATSRLDALLAAGAEVTIVAPEIRGELERPGVTLRRRGFEPGDLDGAWLVVSAAPAAVNRQVYALAQARQVFVNSIDDPTTASAYGGGVLRREGLTLGISTEGRAPALAGLLREGLDALIPEDLSNWLETATSLRAGWKAVAIPISDRRPLLLRALNELYAKRGATW